MSKSFCIKTNNKKIINYLLNKFKDSNIKHLHVSKNQFKIYSNIIVHYTGKNLDLFYSIFSDILSSCIIHFFEKDLIKHIININYFYFTDIDQRKIYDIANEYIKENEINECIST